MEGGFRRSPTCIRIRFTGSDSVTKVTRRNQSEVCFSAPPPHRQIEQRDAFRQLVVQNRGDDV